VMRMHRLAACALVAASLALPAAAGAQAVGTTLKQSHLADGKTAIDPANGYILITMSGVTSTAFLRVPDDDTRKAWAADRDVAFAKAQKQFAKAHDQWRSDSDMARKTDGKIPPEPVAPTLDTFTYDPIETRDMVSMEPESGFNKKIPRVYIAVVKPGTYVWYSHDGFNAGGPVPDGVCFCMGTVQFQVKPGVVTDLGTWMEAVPHWNDDMDVARMIRHKRAEQRRSAGKSPGDAEPYTVDLAHGLPPAMKDWPSVTPEFHAHGKINNYQGLIVSRVGPVPGVLSYDRDRVIDAATGQPLADPLFEAMQKIKP
jgi:hypothetical protein